MYTPSSPTIIPRRLPAAVAAVLLAMLLSSASARAATFTVGGDSACTHTTLQAAVNAAQSLPEPSVIRIARSASFIEQAVLVDAARNLELTGGYATCAQAVADNVKTTLDGAGTLSPVLSVHAATGVAVIVRKLRLQNAELTGFITNGGGINFGGNGVLEIHDSDVIGNLARRGGGIYAEGTGNQAELIIGANVLIAGNEAPYGGGGVLISGLKMTMIEPNSAILLNSALGTSDTNGYGGGLLIRSDDNRPGLAVIGGAGIGTLGVIGSNEARVGGGVAVIDGEDSDAEAKLLLFSAEAGRPAAIRDNFASVAGGGLFVEERDHIAHAELWNAEITGNIAPSGAAIYLTRGGGCDSCGGRVSINAVRPAGALFCTPGVPCGAISGNVSQLPNGQLTDGATIQIQRRASAAIGSSRAGIVLRGNRGGRLIDVQPEAAADVVNALMVDNLLGEHLLRAQGDLVRIADTTIAGNGIGTGDVLAFNANLDLRRSILWQPGMTSLSHSGGTLLVSSVFASETASLGGEPFAIDVDPLFIDPSRGDYRLSAASPAVDYAPAIDGDDRDTSGAPRDVDLPFKPNAVGPRDIGAFERQSIGELIANDTFDTGIEPYALVTPGSTVWDGTQNSGAAGSGSAKVAGSSTPGARLVGAKRCIHLPGPGRYLLNGHGMTAFAVGAQRDSALLHWELRHDGGQGCESGPADAAGDHLLSRDSSFVTPAQPAVIVVEPELWSVNSSLTVFLVMVDNGLAVQGSVTGWFDGITLIETPFSDVIFANDFQFGASVEP